MTAPPRLSTVVLCSAGEWPALERCLTAITAHPPRGGHEVIVVDNAAGVAATVNERFPAVRVLVNAENAGVGPGRNQGLEVAGGRLLSVLDSDAYVSAGALETLCAFLEANPTVGLVGPRLTYDDGSFQASRRRLPSCLAVAANRVGALERVGRGAVDRYLMTGAPQDVTMEVDYVLGAAMVWRRPALPMRFAGIRYGFDDAEFCLRIRRHVGRVVWLPSATVVHGYRRRTVGTPVNGMAV